MKLPIGFFVASAVGLGTLLLAFYGGAMVIQRLDPAADKHTADKSHAASAMESFPARADSFYFADAGLIQLPSQSGGTYFFHDRSSRMTGRQRGHLSPQVADAKAIKIKRSPGIDGREPNVPWSRIQEPLTSQAGSGLDTVSPFAGERQQLPSEERGNSTLGNEAHAPQVAFDMISPNDQPARAPMRLAINDADLAVDVEADPDSRDSDLSLESGRPHPGEVRQTSLETAQEAAVMTSSDPVALREDHAQSSSSTGRQRVESAPSRDLDEAPQSTIQPAKDPSQQIVGWPLPTALIEDLNELANLPVTSLWAAAALDSFQELNRLELGDPASLSLLTHCGQLADQLHQYSIEMAQTQPHQFAQAALLTRVAYRIRRRMDIWQVVHELAVQGSMTPRPTDTKQMAEQISTHKQQITASIPADWNEYLMLDRAESIFSADKPSRIKRQAISRKILARVNSPSLTSDQRDYARQVVGDELLEHFLQAATGPLELGEFVDDLENYELDAGVLETVRFNNHFQNYYWNEDPRINRLAETINAHYRNANFRIEVSDQMINRLLPQTMNFNEPVRDQILGAKVYGQSRVQNRVQVRLIPDPEHLRFRLQSLGSILSRTRAHHSGFVFDSLGNANVNASKGIAIGSQGVATLPTNVAASSKQKLLGVRSRFDGLPMLGWMARRIAQQQQASKQTQTKQVVERKIKFEFQSRVDREIQQGIVEAQDWFDSHVLQPLNTLELEPKPMEMRTTDNEVIVRYRVAAPDQMAAHSARPHSQPGSLVSMQLHQSAINNVLNRIQINGQEFTIDEFVQHLNHLLETDDLKLPQDQSHDVTFEFASRDGLHLEFHDDRVAITLRLKRLKLGKRQSWRNLTVKAIYFPRANGRQMEMVLDEQTGLLLTGKRLNFRDQVAVRTVFNSLFKPHFEFPLIPESATQRFKLNDLTVSQLVLANGWIGISMQSTRQAHQNGDRDSRILRPRTSRLFRLLR